MRIAEELQALEGELFKVAVRKDVGRVAALLTEDFREFGSSGRVFTKAEIIAALAEEEPVSLSMRDFRLVQLTPELALATYRATRLGDGSPPTDSLRSSLWRLGAGGWQMMFHQGTKVPAEKR